MKILFISTYDIQGGAAIAASRLLHAMRDAGEDASMVVRTKSGSGKAVFTAGNKKTNRLRFYWERGVIYLHNRLSRRNLFDVSIANTGVPVTELPQFKEADVIHLHWINQGMLSMKEIGQILASGKKVIWTMHDMWPFTGICHHAKNCDNYLHGCGNCIYLKKPSIKDLSYKVFQKKQNIFQSGEIHFICVSNWLKSKAEKSPLSKGQKIDVIPNVIDTNLFAPKKESTNDFLGKGASRKTIVMGAARLDHPIKGFDLLKKALQLLIDKKKIAANDLQLVLYGDVKFPDLFFRDIPVDYVHFGVINNPKKIAEIFTKADVTVVPSLYETFGQTIIEAMSCGCPVVSFNNSGQTDIIDHLQNGYLAKYNNNLDFAEGIRWALFDADKELVKQNARQKVMDNYTEDIIVKKYKEIYHA